MPLEPGLVKSCSRPTGLFSALGGLKTETGSVLALLVLVREKCERASIHAKEGFFRLCGKDGLFFFFLFFLFFLLGIWSRQTQCYVSSQLSSIWLDAADAIAMWLIDSCDERYTAGAVAGCNVQWPWQRLCGTDSEEELKLSAYPSD